MTIKIEHPLTKVETLLAIELAKNYDASKFDKRLITMISSQTALAILPTALTPSSIDISCIAEVFIELMLLAKLCDNNSLYPIPITASKELLEATTVLDADVIFATLYAGLLEAFSKGLHDKALQIVWRIAANLEYIVNLYGVDITPKSLESMIEPVLLDLKRRHNGIGTLPKAN